MGVEGGGDIKMQRNINGTEPGHEGANRTQSRFLGRYIKKIFVPSVHVVLYFRPGVTSIYMQ